MTGRLDVCFPQLPSRKAELPEVEMILQDDSPAADEHKEEEIQEDGESAQLMRTTNAETAATFSCVSL